MSKTIKTRIHFDYTFHGYVEGLLTSEKWEKIKNHAEKYGIYSDSSDPILENPLGDVEYFVRNSRSQRDFINSAWTPRGVIISKDCLEFLLDFSIPEHQVFKINCKNSESELLDYHLLVFNAAPFYLLNFKACEFFVVDKDGFEYDSKTKRLIPQIVNDNIVVRNAAEYFDFEKSLKKNEQLYVNKYVFDKNVVPFYDLFYMSGDNQTWYVSENMKKRIKKQKLRGVKFTNSLHPIEWS